MAVCDRCKKKVGMFSLWNGLCEDCLTADEEERRATEEQAAEAKAAEARQAAEALSRIIVTTETAHNLPVKERLGIVTGECVFGLNIVKDVLSGVRDIVGGRSGTLQKALNDAQAEAIAAMKERAKEQSADAIVGVAFTHSQVSGGAGSMIAVIATGTAVTLSG